MPEHFDVASQGKFVPDEHSQTASRNFLEDTAVGRELSLLGSGLAAVPKAAIDSVSSTDNLIETATTVGTSAAIGFGLGRLAPLAVKALTARCGALGAAAGWGLSALGTAMTVSFGSDAIFHGGRVFSAMKNAWESKDNLDANRTVMEEDGGRFLFNNGLGLLATGIGAKFGFNKSKLAASEALSDSYFAKKPLPNVAEIKGILPEIKPLPFEAVMKALPEMKSARCFDFVVAEPGKPVRAESLSVVHAKPGSLVHALTDSTVFGETGATIYADKGSSVFTRPGVNVFEQKGSTVFELSQSLFDQSLGKIIKTLDTVPEPVQRKGWGFSMAGPRADSLSLTGRRAEPISFDPPKPVDVPSENTWTPKDGKPLGHPLDGSRPLSVRLEMMDPLTEEKTLKLDPADYIKLNQKLSDAGIGNIQRFDPSSTGSVSVPLDTTVQPGSLPAIYVNYEAPAHDSVIGMLKDLDYRLAVNHLPIANPNFKLCILRGGTSENGALALPKDFVDGPSGKQPAGITKHDVPRRDSTYHPRGAYRAPYTRYEVDPDALLDIVRQLDGAGYMWNYEVQSWLPFSQT
jgi:hypothetical protein